jgi:hypothetical protein
MDFNIVEGLRMLESVLQNGTSVEMVKWMKIDGVSG